MPSQRRIGEYVIGSRIAVGGMAEVFCARRADDASTAGWPLVLKILLPQLSEDLEVVQMFADEAQLTVALDHPNLVKVEAFGEHNGQRFIAMERVDGVPLSRLLKRVGRLPLPAALRVARGVLSALEYIHTRRDEDGQPLGIVHRDVTPSNVLLSRGGEVKLGDFGIARFRARQARTRTGVIKGTVQYMAPEQVTGSGIDRRSDIYGAGLLLFEMVCGRRLLEADSEAELLKMAERPPWIAPSTLCDEAPAALDELLRPALERFPEERYGSAARFAAALERIGVAPGGAEALGALVESVADPAPAPPRSLVSTGPARGRRVWLAAFAVAAAAGGAWLWRSASPDPDPDRPVLSSSVDTAPVAGAVDAGAASAPRRDGGMAAAADGGSRDGAAAADSARRPVQRPARRAGALRGRRRPVQPTQRPDAAAASARASAATTAARKARIGAIERQLRGRGIRRADLPAALRSQLAAVARRA